MFATIFYGEGNLPYFWDVTPGTPTRSDLNPLANPALERNLSRWAEVYFGNPPEKRDEAVNRLLQEIKNETSEILDAERARRESSARSSRNETFRDDARRNEVVRSKRLQKLISGQARMSVAPFASTEILRITSFADSAVED